MARIKKLIITGYRSIGDAVEINFPEGKPLILIGENNSGKSNIVKAINLVLGQFHPAYHQPDDHEFFERDQNKKIEIKVEFDPEDRYGDKYTEVVWRYNKNSPEPLQYRGRSGQLYGSSDGYIRSEHRDSCICVLVEAERNLAYHLGYSSKWTMLSRLMHRFHRALSNEPQIKNNLEKLFCEIKNNFYNVPQFGNFIIELQNQMDNLIGSMTYRLNIDFEAYNPVNFFHALRLQAKENNEPRTLEEMGTGEQQLLALCFAHAYAKAFHGGIVFVIEEPEAHLHPLAQKWLAKRLDEYCQDGLQILITTHSPSFININNLEGIVWVFKENGQTKVKQININDLIDYCIKTGVPQNKISEVSVLPFYNSNSTTEILSGFFSKCVVLVEGPTESLALPVYLSKCGFDVLREGVAIIPVLGKGNLAKWVRLFSVYGIPCYTIFDNDSNDDRNKRKREDILKALNIQNPDEYLISEDILINNDFAVFGVNFETSLRNIFYDYQRLEQDAKENGIESKPFIAKWVAEKLDINDDKNNNGKEIIERLIDAIKSKII